MRSFPRILLYVTLFFVALTLSLTTHRAQAVQTLEASHQPAIVSHPLLEFVIQAWEKWGTPDAACITGPSEEIKVYCSESAQYYGSCQDHPFNDGFTGGFASEWKFVLYYSEKLSRFRDSYKYPYSYLKRHWNQFGIIALSGEESMDFAFRVLGVQYEPMQGSSDLGGVNSDLPDSVFFDISARIAKGGPIGLVKFTPDLAYLSFRVPASDEIQTYRIERSLSDTFAYQLAQLVR